MFTAVWFARFAQGTAKEEGCRYRAEYDGPMGASTSIERYVQNHVIGPIPSATGAGADPFFDGYSLGSWRDRAAFDETMASPGWQALVEDGPNVFAMTWLEGMSAELREFTVIEGPSSPFKVVWIADIKEGLDTVEAHAYWESVHGSICKEMEIDRYVQYHVVGSLEEVNAPGFDGFSELWFKDEAQFRRAMESDAGAAAMVDGPNLFDMSALRGAVLEERVVKEALEDSVYGPTPDSSPDELTG